MLEEGFDEFNNFINVGASDIFGDVYANLERFQGPPTFISGEFKSEVKTQINYIIKLSYIVNYGEEYPSLEELEITLLEKLFKKYYKMNIEEFEKQYPELAI